MLRRKRLFFVLFVVMLTAQGCGAKSTGQTIHESDTDIVASIAPSPAISMQPEQIEIDFSNHKANIQDVSVQFAMPDMAMSDKIQLTETTSDKYQGNYRFSMTGKWSETITYKIDGKTQTATTTWDVLE